MTRMRFIGLIISIVLMIEAGLALSLKLGAEIAAGFACVGVFVLLITNTRKTTK